jgi:hypothetical protein
MTLIPKIVIAHRADSTHSWHSRGVFLAFQPHGSFISIILRNFVKAIRELGAISLLQTLAFRRQATA